MVQKPQGSQEAAGQRVKGQDAFAAVVVVFAPAQPEPDVQHRPVTAARPGAAQEVKGQPPGAPPTVPRLQTLAATWKVAGSVVRFSLF